MKYIYLPFVYILDKSICILWKYNNKNEHLQIIYNPSSKYPSGQMQVLWVAMSSILWLSLVAEHSIHFVGVRTQFLHR